MWLVMIFTKGGQQYEYSVLPEKANPTIDEIVTQAMQAHILNLLSGIIEMRRDGGNELSEVIVMTSLKHFPEVPAFC